MGTDRRSLLEQIERDLMATLAQVRTEIEALPPARKVVNVIALLDASASMAPLTKATIDGFNEFIAKQRLDTSTDVNVTVATFGGRDDYNMLYKRVPLAELPALTEQTYIANGGSTALNDAVMQTLDEYTSLTTDATANVVLVITDGQENSSKHSRAQAIAVIDRLKAKGTWTFAYIGSDPSTWAEAGAYGFASGSTWTYTPTYGGTVSAYAIVSESMSSLRSLVNSSDVTSTADFFNQATSDTVKKPVTP